MAYDKWHVTYNIWHALNFSSINLTTEKMKWHQAAIKKCTLGNIRCKLKAGDWGTDKRSGTVDNNVAKWKWTKSAGATCKAGISISLSGRPVPSLSPGVHSIVTNCLLGVLVSASQIAAVTFLGCLLPPPLPMLPNSWLSSWSPGAWWPARL